VVNQYTGYSPLVNPTPNSHRWWDDNGVIALMLMQAFEQRPNGQPYLNLASELWPFLLSGQAIGGGQHWYEGDPAARWAISATGSDDQMALLLHLATGPANRTSPYLAFAQLNSQWVNANMRAPDGFVWDSYYPNPVDNPCAPQVDSTMHVCEWKWTYNQGWVIGTDVLLYQITGNSQYLADAAQTANTALAYFTPERIWTQPAPFNAFFFRSLLALDSYVHEPRYLGTLEAYLDRVWTEARDRSTGFFNLGGIGLYNTNGGYGSLDQAVFAQMFAYSVYMGAGSGPAITTVVTAASGSPAIAPNTWVEIHGANLAPSGAARIWQDSDFAGNRMPTQLDGVSVTVNGKAAYVYYISPAQVNVLTPPDALPGTEEVRLTYNGASATYTAAAQPASPSFFVFNGGPYVAAVHPNGSLIGPASLYPGKSTPAKPGETVQLYANGFGATSIPVVSGSTAQSATLSPLPAVEIGGIPATVAFAGLVAPGEFQFNVVVPPNAADGDNSLTAAHNGISTQSGVVITVQH
jgi:uncharacterized protein (TIGR03437 family)